MNRWQASRQLVYLAKAATAGSVAVFGGVVEAALPATDFLASGLATPTAVVRTLEADEDPERPDRVALARFRLSIFSAGVADARGPSAYVGASGTAAAQKEVEKAAKDLSAYLNDGVLVDSTHGFQGRFERLGAHRFATGPEKWHVVVDLDTLARLTVARTYHAAHQLTATAGGAGAINLAWANPPDRFDWAGNVLRRSVAGGVVPASATDGTGVTITGGVKGVAAAVTGLAAGTYQFALFAGYDETNDPATTAERYSAAATASATAT